MESSVEDYDCIMVDKLRLSATVGPDRWGKVRPQPIVLSAKLHVIRGMMIEAGRSDDVSDSIHYGHLAKELTSVVDGHEFKSLYDVAWATLLAALRRHWSIMHTTIEASAENQFLKAEALDFVAEFNAAGRCQFKAIIRNLDVCTIIGVNAPEREEKQRVVVNISFISGEGQMGDLIHRPADWKQVHSNLVAALEKTTYLTLEAFAHEAARLALYEFNASNRVTVRAQKPSAIANASSSGVQITRIRADFR